MPITDAAKKQIAQQRRLFFKICFKCGAQESHLDYKMQEVPWQPNEAKEQDAGSQEVTKASMSFRVSP